MDKGWLEGFPALSAFISATALLLSLTHEWAYFSVVAPELRGILSVQDYFRLVIQWIPASLIGMLIGMAFHLFFSRVERGKSEEELIASSPWPRFTKWFRKSADVALPGVIALPPVIYGLFAPRPHALSALIAVGALVWFPLARWIFSVEAIASRYTPRVRLAVVMAPSVFLLVYAQGLQQGIQDMERPRDAYLLTRSDGIKVSGTILGTIERGVLIRDYEVETNYLIQWSDLASITHAGPLRSRPPVACSFVTLSFCEVLTDASSRKPKGDEFSVPVQ